MKKGRLYFKVVKEEFLSVAYDAEHVDLAKIEAIGIADLSNMLEVAQSCIAVITKEEYEAQGGYDGDIATRVAECDCTICEQRATCPSAKRKQEAN